MVWRLPSAALLAVVAGVPLAMLFDWLVRGVAPNDPLAAGWYVGLALVAMPLAMFGMALGGTVVHRTGIGARVDQPALAAGAGAIGGLFGAAVVTFVFFSDAPALRQMALGYGALFGATSGLAFWLFYRKPFRRAAKAA